MTVIRFLTGSWASRVYLLLVLAATGYLLVDTAFVEHEDASFAGIWLLLLTGPGSWLSMPLVDAGPAWLHPLTFWIGAAVGALLNTVLLSVLSRRSGRGQARPRSGRADVRPRPGRQAVPTGRLGAG